MDEDFTTFDENDSCVASFETSHLRDGGSTSKPPLARGKKQRLANKLSKLIKSRNIPEEFVSSSLMRIVEFLYDRDTTQIVFKNMNVNKMFFLLNVENLAQDESLYMLVSGPCQKHLSVVKRFMMQNMLYKISTHKKGHVKQVNKIHDIRFHKLSQFPPIQFEEHVKEEDAEDSGDEVQPTEDIPKYLAAPLGRDVDEKMELFKQLKYDIIKTSGEDYIHKCLKLISEFFLNEEERNLNFRCSNQGQALLIKHVEDLCVFDEGYALFSNECQELLKSIKWSSKGYNVKYLWKLDAADDNFTNVVVKKKRRKFKKSK